MEEVVLYRRGKSFHRVPAAEAEPVRVILAPGVMIDKSPYNGEDRFYRLTGTVGLDLQTALDAGWCRIAVEPVDSSLTDDSPDSLPPLACGAPEALDGTGPRPL